MNVDKSVGMEPAERQAAIDKLVPGIEPSDYGKMPPSFYSNSQRVTRPTMENDMREDVLSTSPSSTTDAPRSRPIRAPILTRDKYEGIDSDDESDEEGDDDDEFEDEKPQVEGDIDVNMEEEQEEFLEFARQALGISEDQWNQIIDDRRNQGGEFSSTTSEFSYMILILLSISLRTRIQAWQHRFPEKGNCTTFSIPRNIWQST
jgi:hypothetical protein